MEIHLCHPHLLNEPPRSLFIFILFGFGPVGLEVTLTYVNGDSLLPAGQAIPTRGVRSYLKLALGASLASRWITLPRCFSY